jgi:hypothetical protein
MLASLITDRVSEMQHGWEAVHIATYWGFDKMAQLLSGWQGAGSLGGKGSEVSGTGVPLLACLHVMRLAARLRCCSRPMHCSTGGISSKHSTSSSLLEWQGWPC